MKWRLVRRPLTGELHGSGFVANCVVLVQQLVSSASPPVLGNLDFIWIDTQLPDGDFTLTFEDQSLNLHHTGNAWAQCPANPADPHLDHVKRVAS